MAEQKRTSGRVTTAKSTLGPQSAGTPVAALVKALKPFNPWTHPERLEVNVAFVDVTGTGDILNDGREGKAPPAVADER